MARYIDAEKLIAFANNSTVGVDANDIARFPAEDVTPVVHAKWIKSSDDGLLECSNCGAYVFEHNNILPNYYCRGCGAKMDGGEEI